MIPSKRLIFLFLIALSVLFAACRNKGVEKPPHWLKQYHFFQENEYQAFLTKKIEALTDADVAFSAQIKEYYDKEKAPFWTANGYQEERVAELMEFIAHSDEHGLSPNVFGYTTFNKLIDSLKTGKVKTAENLYEMLAQAELLLTDAYVQYAKDLSYGATDPKEVNGGKWLYETIYPDETFIKTTLEVMKDVKTYLSSVQPTDTNYVRLQTELKKFLALGDTVLPKIPYVKAKKSQQVANVKLVGERLRFLGEMPADYAPNDLFDEALLKGLNHFRYTRGIPEGDTIGAETIDMLNEQPKYYIHKISTNLERMRWKTTHQKGENFIAVNPADFHLVSKCQDTLLTMKICCGKYPVKRRTDTYDGEKLLRSIKSESPLLYSEINMIVLNPEWNVPETIFADEYYPKFLKNPGYIQKHHYYLVDLKTKKEVLPETINWHKVRQKNIPYKLVQSSGKWNALGSVKFNFPNSESVYLHDTDIPSAFKRRKRALSHGCIRVEKPRELMRQLLVMNDYDTVKLEQTYIILGDEPTTEKGEEFLEEREKKEEEYFDKLAPEDTIFYRPLRPTNVFLKKKMPLFIEYFTCYVDFNGDINYRPDLYEKEGNVLYLLRKLEH